MEKSLFACCGIDCSSCEVYKVTVNNDIQGKKRLAWKTSEMLNRIVKPSQINCLGCMNTSDIKISYCKECLIRACCTDKGFKNCSECLEYPCRSLSKFHSSAKEAKENLSKLLLDSH